MLELELHLSAQMSAVIKFVSSQTEDSTVTVTSVVVYIGKGMVSTASTLESFLTQRNRITMKSVWVAPQLV